MFVDAVVGEKGTGKTPVMLEILTREAKDEHANMVFVESGKSASHHIPHSVRFIDITEYSIQGYDQLLAFIAGMNAKDYDISHIFIDSVFKIAGDEALESLADFINRLEKLARLVETNITLSLSCAVDELPWLPDSIKIHMPHAN
ncbi:MAG: ATP-binding protein [Saccharofermentanales bacterium]|jgi:predicted ATP-dependent serine protease|nr:ATP-binding protein [Clostridiaceae bacterium]